MNKSIIAANIKQDIGCRVVLWNEDPFYSFYNHKYSPRNISKDQLDKQIKLMCLHHAGEINAKATYDKLIERGLSVNFIIDDDNQNGFATIYQCLDIKDIGYSQGEFNDDGPGVEIAYLPQAWKDPNLYPKEAGHPIINEKIHNVSYKTFGPTLAQVNSTIALINGFCKLFPNVKKSFPQENNQFIKTVVKNPHGIVSHFNLTTNKIDPAGFPFEYVQKQLNGNQTLPSKMFDLIKGIFK